jgi:hypothetical protein
LLWVVACLGGLLGGVDGPLPARAALGLVLVTANLSALRRTVLLRGARAVRRLDWDEAGRFQLQLGSDPAELVPAVLRPASFRLGIAFLVLWFSTPRGRRVVLVDGGRQDPVAFRRLARRLARGMLIPSGPKV